MEKAVESERVHIEPTCRLRFIKKRGRMILQQLNIEHHHRNGTVEHVWLDVPVVEVEYEA